MALLTDAEKHQLFRRISREIEATPYACSTLSQLTSGTTNFVFRGILTHPLQHENSALPIKSVIVKHSTSFAGCNKDFPVDISRFVYLYPSLLCSRRWYILGRALNC
jgi:hypothetical protein